MAPIKWAHLLFRFSGVMFLARPREENSRKASPKSPNKRVLFVCLTTEANHALVPGTPQHLVSNVKFFGHWKLSECG